MNPQSLTHPLPFPDTGTDELSTDEKVRSASRAFRQLFDVPPSERLVSCMFTKEYVDNIA